MFLTVTSPKKGLGQTITSINLAADYANVRDKAVNIIDMNRYCRDIEYFLSDTNVTKGLDDFLSLRYTGSLDTASFHNCIKKVNRNVHIMASNNYLDLSERDLELLLEYTEALFDLTIVDSIGGKHPTTSRLFEKSDWILVLLNQSKRVVDMIGENENYYEYKDKVVFILNKRIEEHKGRRVGYGLREIEADLKKQGFGESRLFPLDYDVEVLNECNDKSVLNFIFSRNPVHRPYQRQMKAIWNYLLLGDTKEIQMKFSTAAKMKHFSLYRLFGSSQS